MTVPMIINKINNSTKIVIVIENIDIYFSKEIEEKIVFSLIEKVSNNENIYLIATSNKPYNIRTEIINLFD